MQIKVLDSQNIDKVLHFEEQRALRQFEDSMELEFHKWQAPWRKESLEHYIVGGWSFGVWSSTEDLEGYFLAQPLVFFDGQTQSLWMEWLSYNDVQVGQELVELAVGYSREKHFQRVLVAGSELHETILQNYEAPVWKGDVRWIKTTKG